MPKLHSKQRLSINGATRISMAGFNGGNPRGEVLGTLSTGACYRLSADELAQLRQLQ